jgi:hypothetical protein
MVARTSAIASCQLYVVEKSSIITSSHYIVIEKYQISSLSLLQYISIAASSQSRDSTSLQSFIQSVLHLLAIFRVNITGGIPKLLHRFSSGDICDNARVLLFDTATNPALGPTKSTIRFLPLSVPLGVRQP